jgi:KDO2-lipid IV(A) lauroyltransferase
VVVALPHAGNWDHAGSYFCIKGAQLVTVAEILKPRALFEKFLEYRQAIGMEVLPLDGSAFGTLLERAQAGKLIALVADRDLSRSGIDVKFFGGTARMPAGPALVAIRTSSPLVTAFVSYTADGIHIQLESIEIPTDGDEDSKVKAIVQRCHAMFEADLEGLPSCLRKLWARSMRVDQRQWKD